MGAHLGGHVSPSTLSAHRMARAGVTAHSSSAEWEQLSEAGKTSHWDRRTNQSVWQPPAGVEVVWVGTMDEEGVPYRWHKGERVSTYDHPPLPVRSLASPHLNLPLRPCDRAAEVSAIRPVHVLEVAQIQFTIRVLDILAV